MAKLYNLARMTTATTGTGTITLGSAVDGFKSFAAAGVSNGETVTYALRDGNNSEIGRGVYSSSGTTLTRSVLKSTNADSAIDLSGSAEVVITPAMEDLSFLQSGTGAVRRTFEDKFRELSVSAKDFGATGDGTTDDTAAINLCLAAAESANASVYFPAGTYITSTGVELWTGAHVYGDGVNTTVIKAKNSSNCNVVYGRGVGTSTQCDEWVLHDIQLDGNRANNSTGHGLYVYGRRFTVYNVGIIRAAEDGIRIDFNESFDQFGPTAHLENVYIDDVGKNGMYNLGPSDSKFINVEVIDCSQAADNTYYGFYLGSGGNGRFFGCHIHHRSSVSNRMFAALYIDTGSSVNNFSSCHFEGSATSNVYIVGTANVFSGCSYYSCKGGRNIVVRSALNRIDGYLGPKLSGGTDCIGVTLGLVSGDDVRHNNITVVSDQQEGGLIDWTHSDGYNQVIANGTITGTTIGVGSPHASDIVSLRITGGASLSITKGYIINLADSVSGQLPIANGGTGDSGTAWATTTPTVGFQSGSGTVTATVAYKTFGKTCHINIIITITSIGTATGYLSIPLPVTPLRQTFLSGLNTATPFSTCAVTAGSDLLCFKYDGSAPGTTGHTVYFGGTLETA